MMLNVFPKQNSTLCLDRSSAMSLHKQSFHIYRNRIQFSECHNIKFRDSYIFRIESIDIHSIMNFLQRCCCLAPEITHDSWIKWFFLYCFPWKYYETWLNHIEYLSFGVFDWQFQLCRDVLLPSFFPWNEYKIAFRWKYLRFRSTLVNSTKWCE